MRVIRNRIFRRTVSVLLLICWLLALNAWVGELLSPVSYALCFRHDIQEAEKSGKGADLVFIGASRVYRTFDPEVFEKEMGLDCVVNAGSSSQPISASYFEMRDMIERLHPRRVILGVTWNMLKDRADLQARLIVWDRLSDANRLRMAVRNFSPAEWPFLSGVYRHKDRFTVKKIETNLAEKQKLAESGFAVLEHEDEYYAGKGFVYGCDSIPTGNVPLKAAGGFSTEQITEENLRYLEACVALCREKDVELVLVSGVTTVMRMYVTGNYQGAVDYYTEFAKRNGIVYYNLNYLKGREEFLPDEMMHDYNHVNGEGARIVSEKLAEILNRADRGEDVSGFFYENLEAFRRDVHRIVSVEGRLETAAEDPGLRHVSVRSLQNADVNVVYRALLRQPGETEFRVIRDWAPETHFDLRLEGDTAGAVLRIEAGSTEETCGRAYREYDL